MIALWIIFAIISAVLLVLFLIVVLPFAAFIYLMSKMSRSFDGYYEAYEYPTQEDIAAVNKALKGKTRKK